MSRIQQSAASAWLERIYLLTIAIKGFDGLVEFIAGIIILVAPSWLHTFLAFLSGRASESSHEFIQDLAVDIAHVDTDITRSGMVVIILFLLIHGIVKLALVYALLKRILWAYPYALGVLVLFLIYQLYVCIAQPTFAMAFFVVLDAVIVYVVWAEWKKLRQEAAEHQESEAHQ